jgi:hypothetical protein
MSGFLDDVAGAAMPVAVVLLVLAVAARAVLWAELDHPPARRIARQYLEPLTTWCLIALVTYAVGLGAAGKASLLTLGVPLVLAAVAILLRPGEHAEEPARVEADDRPAPAPGSALWADGRSDESTPRRGLWSR